MKDVEICGEIFYEGYDTDTRLLENNNIIHCFQNNIVINELVIFLYTAICKYLPPVMPKYIAIKLLLAMKRTSIILRRAHCRSRFYSDKTCQIF